MASGDTLLIFLPQNSEPPSANFAAFDLRAGHPILSFDDTTQEIAIFTAILPRNYAGGVITVYVHFCISAVLGTVGFDSAMERIGDQQQDIDSDSFATAKTITAVTVPGTAGLVDIVNVAHTNGAEIDSIAVGEAFRFRLRRDVANDTATGDAQVVAIELKET